MSCCKFSVVYTINIDDKVIYRKVIAKSLDSKSEAQQVINTHIDVLMPSVPELFDSLEVYYPDNFHYQCQSKSGLHKWFIRKRVVEE